MLRTVCHNEAIGPEGGFPGSLLGDTQFYSELAAAP